MVDINVGDVYITSGSVSGNIITGGTTVRIDTTKIDYNYDNQIAALPIPVPKGERGSVTPFARAIDLKRINEAITVQGFLSDEAAASPTTKRDNLLTLGKLSGVLTIVWGQSPNRTIWTANVDPETNTGMFINKMTFTETTGKLGEKVSGNPTRESNIGVQIQVIRGKDL